MSGGSCPGGNYSAAIALGAKVREQFSWGNFMEGNCPGGGFPGRNYSGVIVLGGKSPGVGNSPGGSFKGSNCPGDSCPG